MRLQEGGLDNAVMHESQMMIGTRGRIAYIGRFGSHSRRVMPAAMVYFGIRNPFSIVVGERKREAFVAVVPAHVAHQVYSADQYGAQLTIEPETVEGSILSALPADLNGQRAVAERLLTGFTNSALSIEDCESFDQRFFGYSLKKRRIDRRVQKVIDCVVERPEDKHLADYYADMVGLSVSRFSHLFRAETGTTFRRFCAWKRVRAVMSLMKTKQRLVDTALAAGYADSTHFCHSLQHFLGIRPTDLSKIMTPENFHLAISGNGRGPCAPDFQYRLAN